MFIQPTSLDTNRLVGCHDAQANENKDYSPADPLRVAAFQHVPNRDIGDDLRVRSGSH